MKVLKHTVHSLYDGSKLINDIRTTQHLSCFDIDGTLTGGSEGALEEVRTRAERAGALVFSTARTPELCWSSSAYEASRLNGFNRPEPRIPKNELGKRYFKPLELQEEFNNLLDPDAVLSLGTGIWLRTDEGYTEDKSYAAKLTAFPDWRRAALDLLQYIDEGDVVRFLSKIDHPHMYETRDIDVSILPFRIKLEFPTLEAKLAVGDRIAEVAKSYHALSSIARNIECVDESNLEQDRYILYLLPLSAPKEKSLQHFLSNIHTVSDVPPSDISLLLTGDTLTDMKAGCLAGADTQGTFILVGGSQLATLFDGSYPEAFAGVSMQWLWNSLQETERPGFFIFKQNNTIPRIIVVGDLAYPGTKGPETILEYMKEHNY